MVAPNSISTHAWHAVPAEGAYSAPHTPSLDLRDLLLMRGRGNGEGRGRGEEAGKGTGGEGRGGIYIRLL